MITIGLAPADPPKLYAILPYVLSALFAPLGCRSKSSCQTTIFCAVALVRPPRAASKDRIGTALFRFLVRFLLAEFVSGLMKMDAVAPRLLERSCRARMD